VEDPRKRLRELLKPPPGRETRQAIGRFLTRERDPRVQAPEVYKDGLPSIRSAPSSLADRVLERLPEGVEQGARRAARSFDRGPVGAALQYVRGSDPSQLLADAAGGPIVGAGRRVAATALKSGDNAIQAALGAADDLPGGFAYQKTQRSNTTPTYEAALREIQRLGGSGRGIDYGAGLGVGARKIGFEDTFEPFPKNPFVPTFTNPSDIPSSAYGRLTNLNSLNVLPRNIRDEAVENIGRIIEPGGYGVITTRGGDVMSAKGVPGPEPMSLITGLGTYQKGFTNSELQDYLKYILGDRFDVSSARIGSAPASSTIYRKR